MAIACVLVPLDQLSTIELLAHKSVCFVVPSRKHWEAVLIRWDEASLGVASKRSFTFCESWSLPCCTESPSKLAEEHRRRLYNRIFSSGDWINAGHTCRDPLGKQGEDCKQRQKESAQSLIQSLGCKISLEPIEDVYTIESQIQAPLKQLKEGISKLAKGNSGFQRVEISEQELWDIQRVNAERNEVNFDGLHHLLSKKEQECRGLAQNDLWRWGFVIRCVRIIERERLCLSKPADSGRDKRQERAACQINSIVNGLAERVGIFALVIYSAYAATNFKWYRAGEAGAPAEVIDGVVQGIVEAGMKIPEDMNLFNPLAFISWLFGENETRISQELGLKNLSGLQSSPGIGTFKELPLKVGLQHMPPNGEWDLVRTGNEGKIWLNLSLKDDFQGVSSYGSRKRKGTTSSLCRSSRGRTPSTGSNRPAETTTESSAYPEISDIHVENGSNQFGFLGFGHDMSGDSLLHRSEDQFSLGFDHNVLQWEPSM